MGYIGDKKREYGLNWIKARRAAWLEEHGPCVKCGSWEDLEVDHIRREDKLFNVGTLWSLSPGNPKRVSELAKCQVLCHECHLAKTKSETHYAEHGTNSRYTSVANPCRCIPCKAAHAAAVRQWRSSLQIA